MNADPPPEPDAKSQQDPAAFELMRFYEGRTQAYGMFEDRFGRQRARFTVQMTGTWRGAIFEIDELFTFETGDVDRRLWTVYPLDGRTFRATCRDAASEARGRNLPGMVEMTYKFRLPVAGRRVVFNFLDRLYDMGDGRAINRVYISKWGIAIGVLTLCFNKL